MTQNRVHIAAMFIFRWLKRLLVLIGLGTVIWWGIQFVKTNSPVRQKVDKFRQSSVWQEGVKDFKTWASEIFKGVGDKIGDDVTDKEKKQLDDLMKDLEVKKNNNKTQ